MLKNLLSDSQDSDRTNQPAGCFVAGTGAPDPSASRSTPIVSPALQADVTIVIVSWNCRPLLLDVLGSVSALEEARCEVIVVDNDSRDGSADAVEERFPQVRVIRTGANLGFAGGVNQALRVARSPWILLLNPDTRVPPGTVRALLEHGERNPRVGAVGPRVVDDTGRRRESYFAFPTLRDLFFSALYLYKLVPGSRLFDHGRLGHLDPAREQVVESVSGCCLLVRREALDRIGHLDERYFMYVEEVDLCYRLARAGYEVHYLPRAVIVHHGAGSSRLASRAMFLEHRRSVLQFFAKHHGRGAAHVARLLLGLWLLVRTPFWALRSLRPGAAGRNSAAPLGHYLLAIRYLARPLDRILAERPFVTLGRSGAGLAARPVSTPGCGTDD